MSIKMGNEEIQALAVFEKATGAYARDCIKEGDSIYFVVENGKMGSAIGKGGSNIRRVREMLKKNIKVFEYSKDPIEMIKNMIPKAKNVELKDGIAIVSISAVDRSAVIGQRGKNIKIIKELLHRHFDIKDLKLK
ncbi:MAG: NusA-like transcription termination signal-binding factor [Candidatus Micrarchaeota archaeon]|nr:NusA-like transcription termination signal-binding factor [Candidatus Micrarchaeota archaeon]